MLHAPVTDRKNKAESTNSPTLAEHEQQSQTVNWSGRFSFMPDRPSSATIQQAYGNQTTLRMLESQKSPVVDSLQRGVLQRKCACGNAASAAGSCTECQEKQERSLQTKLRISEPGDEYEREADRVADQVMQMPEQSSQTSIETTIQPVAQLQRVSWPWPGNGYVINNSGEPVTVWVGDPAPNGRIYTIPAGSSSGRFTEDIDHIRDRWGHWYKIGANTVTVDANGDVTGYACRVRTYGDDCDSSEMPNAELDAGVSHDAGVPLPGGVLDRKISHVTNSVNNADRPNEAPPIVREALNSPGQPLDSQTRTFMESRFKHDFSQVRVHTSRQAEASAEAVNALAYTIGSDIVFAKGNYAPFAPEGRRLLAHELTHTIQQGGTSVQARRGVASGSLLQRMPSCARPASCPPEYCLEYPTRSEAEADRAANRDRLLSQIGQPVLDGGAGEVRSLYRDFLDGGHALRDLSSRLATFFTRSSTTGRSIRFLDRSLETYFRANPPPPGSSTTVNIQDAIPQAIAALGTPHDPNVMAFRDYTETPGILAGGVGEGQVACRVGAIPSNVEDGRTATGAATGTNSNGTILVSSSIEFTVTDTVDFCPGNCGGSDAQELTVPLSRYEATGISGDEPFTVTFPAPIGAFDSE